jgi:predicted  nucleic acid-binding Zn-ribbon protein
MSSSELYEEIGRLKQRVDDQRVEIGGLREDNETLNEANLAMHEALATANENVRWLDHQLQAQDEEISKLPSR